MKILPPIIDSHKSDPFKDDALGREDYGKGLMNLVTSTNEPLVIALDAPWGEGKTTFVKMWQAQLEQSNVPTIYIDAFAHDYIDDAFALLAGAITAYAKEQDVTIEELKNQIKEVGVNLLDLATDVALKTASGGTLDKNAIKELTENLVDKRLNAYGDHTETFAQFRKQLSSLPNKLHENRKKSNKESTDIIDHNNPKSLVIIIDELDRCKPPFAVHLIETIKHFFSVDSVVFVLAMNKTQLQNAIKGVYGSDTDAKTYLQKFISIETILPNNKDLETGKIAQYSGTLYEHHGFSSFEQFGSTGLNKLQIIPLSQYFKLSLRQIEQAFTYIALFYKCYPKVEPIPIVSILATLKVVDHSYFNRLVQITKETAINEIFETAPWRNRDLTEKSGKNKLESIIDKWFKVPFAESGNFHFPIQEHEIWKIQDVYLAQTHNRSTEDGFLFFVNALNAFNTGADTSE